ncbi:MAG: ROK family protein [Myxococcota bacterium]|nr:ROK family protein [Myxococcota bacterium]
MSSCGAVELGGTWLRLVVGTPDGRISHRAQLPLPRPSILAPTVASWMAEMGGVHRLGVACFGPVRIDRSAADWGTILRTPKPGWSGFAVGPALEAAMNAPVTLETDVGAAALAEHSVRGGTGSLAYMTVGTGIGVGLRLAHGPWHGRMHPELGHMRVQRDPADGFAGVCPFHGDCLEGLASGPALAARTGLPGPAIPPDHPVWRLEAGLLAQAAHVLLAGLSVNTVVLGGGVGTAPGLLERVRIAVSKLDGRYSPGLDARRDLTAPILGDDAALVGALQLSSVP